MVNNTKKRITVTIGETLYDTLKTYGDEMGISVPALLVFYATEHMRQASMLDQLPQMMSTASKLQESIKLVEGFSEMEGFKNIAESLGDSSDN